MNGRNYYNNLNGWAYLHRTESVRSQQRVIAQCSWKSKLSFAHCELRCMWPELPDEGPRLDYMVSQSKWCYFNETLFQPTSENSATWEADWGYRNQTSVRWDWRLAIEADRDPDHCSAKETSQCRLPSHVHRHLWPREPNLLQILHIQEAAKGDSRTNLLKCRRVMVRSTDVERKNDQVNKSSQSSKGISLTNQTRESSKQATGACRVWKQTAGRYGFFVS